MKTEKPANEWFTVATLAAVWGVTPRGFRSSLLPLVGKDARREGRPLLVHGPSVLAAWFARESVKDRANDDSATLAGVSTPMLERIREQRWNQELLRTSEQRRNLIPLGEVRKTFEQGAACLRRICEDLQRAFGQDAGAIVNEELDRLVEIWKRVGAEYDVSGWPFRVEAAAVMFGAHDPLLYAWCRHVLLKAIEEDEAKDGKAKINHNLLR